MGFGPLDFDASESNIVHGPTVGNSSDDRDQSLEVATGGVITQKELLMAIESFNFEQVLTDILDQNTAIRQQLTHIENTLEMLKKRLLKPELPSGPVGPKVSRIKNTRR